MTNRPAPRYRASVKRRASRRGASRTTNPYMLVLALVALAGLAWGAWAVSARITGQPASTSAPTSTEVAQADQSANAAPASHVTFGAHTRADQPCDSCHEDQPDGGIACRNCHGNVCGKDAKSAADCIECHQTGTTKDWAPAKQ